VRLVRSGSHPWGSSRADERGAKMREMPSQLIHHPLRGTVRIASSIVRRHLRHQLVNVRFDDGRSRIRADLDTALGLQLYRYGLEDPDLAAVGRLLGPGDFFIDGGAHVGLFTLVAASRVGPSGLVVACEPAPATRGRLIDNLELNDFSWVTPLGVALSDRRSSAQFVAFDGNGSGLSSFAPAPDVEGGSSMTVHTSTLDEIAGDRIPTLVKLDLEGAEVLALRGAPRLLASGCTFLVEVEPEHLLRQGSTAAELLEIFRSHDYVSSSCGPGPNMWFTAPSRAPHPGEVGR